MPAARSGAKKRKLAHAKDVVMEGSSSGSSSEEEQAVVKDESESEESEAEQVEAEIEEESEDEEEEQETVSKTVDNSSSSSDSEEESVPVVVEPQQEDSSGSESEEESDPPVTIQQEDSSNSDSEDEQPKEEEVKQKHPVKLQVPTQEKSKKLKDDEGLRLRTMRRLLEQFSPQQLVEIMANAATKHDELYTDLKTVVGADSTNRMVLVHKLPSTTKEKTLKKAFAVFGEIEEVSIRHDKADKSPSFAFIIFTELEAAQRAIEKRTITIGEHKVTCKSASAEGQHRPPPGMMYMMPGLDFPPNQPLQKAKHDTDENDKDASGRALFVTGIAHETKEYTIRQEFQKFGELESVVVPFDRTTMKNKGYAFVKYCQKEGAAAALETPHKEIDGAKTTSRLNSKRKKSKEQDGGHGQNFAMPMMPFPGMPPMQQNSGAFPPPGPFGPPRNMFRGPPRPFHGRPKQPGNRPMKPRK